MLITEQAINILEQAFDGKVSSQQITELLEQPKTIANGDLSMPTFRLAKELGASPVEIAKNTVEKISKNISSDFDKIVAAGPYINFFFNRQQFTKETLDSVLKEQQNYGYNNFGDGKNVVIDLSSPNIAKPMSAGHLRSTVIGNAIANLAAKNGFTPVKINHLGDWGTQFGLMMSAYIKWGNQKPLEDYSVQELVQLYIRINKEAELDPSLADDGRNWFKKLEDGDPQAQEMWKKMRDLSLAEFMQVYNRLNIEFDSLNGEAFYNDKMNPVIDELNKLNLLVESDGAKIIEFDPDLNLPIAMIQRSDGATLYITRDLAAAIYRYNTYHFAKSLYVVGAEQREHFRQLKLILKKMNYNWADDMEHVSFGLITFDGKKMSTRKGNVVELVDVLDRAHQLALEQIQEKNSALADIDNVAEAVGAGAVIFHDLMNDRTLSINFDLKDIVQFEGDTGPYVQYTNARAHSIIKKSGKSLTEIAQADIEDVFSDDLTWQIIVNISNFERIVTRAWREYEPSIVAKYALNLARSFNTYYSKSKILVDDQQLINRLKLVQSVIYILTESLRILGVTAPVEM